MPHFLDNELVFLYFLCSIIILFMASLSLINKSVRLDRITLFLSFILITLFYGLRYPGTTDSKMYLGAFDGLSNFDSFTWGWGFYALMKFAAFFGKSHQGYIFISSLFITFSLLVFILYAFKGKSYKSLFMIACFYSWDVLELSTNVYRQGISSVLACLACVLFYRKRFISASAIFFLALSFHWGCVVVVLACVLSYFLTNLKSIIFIARVSLLMFLLAVFVKIDIMSILYNNISSVSFLFSGVNFTSKADAYLAGGVDGANFYDFNIPRRMYNILTTIMPLLLFVIYTFNVENRKYLFSDATNKCILSLFSILSMYGVLLISMTWFMRNFYWNTFFSCAVYPLLLASIQDIKPKKLIKYCVLMSLFLFFLSIITMWRTPSIFLSYP